jgi:hypothetical protein
MENTASCPIVLNLSYSTIAGPHDGSALLEAAINQLIASRATPLRVVLPAGNHYLARCHARFAMPAAKPLLHPIKSLQWRVQPDNQSASFAEIWLPHSQGAQPLPQVEVRVTSRTARQAHGSDPAPIELALDYQRALLHDLRRPVSGGQPSAHSARDGADRGVECRAADRAVGDLAYRSEEQRTRDQGRCVGATR